MKEINLIYTSDNGISFPLVAEGMYLKDASFHEYEYTPEKVSYKYGDLLKLFTKDAIKYKVKLAFSGSETERQRNIEKIHDAWEHDIITQKAGKLTWNGYEIDCYFITSKVYPNDSNTRTMNDVVIYCPYPFWLRETLYQIQTTGEGSVIDGLDFPFDLPCDLGFGGYRKVIPFETTVPLDFRMVIYGEAIDPSIYINGHLYEANITVPANGKLTISSVEKNDREKAMILTYPSGTEASVLYSRNRESYIFEPIIPKNGQVIVSSGQTLTIDLYLVEKRSEPKWT